MEIHKCKVCLRKFDNGRALGGHVRSHMITKSKLFQEKIESLQSSFSFTSSEDEDDENSQKIGFLVDQEEFNIAAASSSVHQESETSRNQFYNIKDSIFRQQPKVGKSSVEESQVSSVSETTSEEDIAYCLIMLSRDKWIKTEPIKKPQVKNQTKVRKSRSSRGKYRCETCDRVFRSYQALGGHRASHKRIKLSNFSSTKEKPVAARNAGNFEEVVKIYECAVCFKVFSSGQALGGHKRSHGATSFNLSSAKTFSVGKALIDLNLPAPIDDEEDYNISQLQVEHFSVVCGDEFVTRSN